MDSNRVRVSVIREATLGVTPASPVMRALDLTGESLRYRPMFANSSTIRSDRNSPDPSKTNEEIAGGVNYEVVYPADRSAQSEFLRSLMFNPWNNRPQHDNGFIAGSIASVVGSTGVITIANQSASPEGFSGTAYQAGHLVRLTGFTQAANNGVYVVASSTATTITLAAGSNMVDETVTGDPDARIKVVGFQGASGVLNSFVSSSPSPGIQGFAVNTALLGLSVGQWVKIGGTGAAFRFANETVNGWGRIIQLTSTTMYLDNITLPADAGTGKTIRIWFGDFIRNGVTRSSLTVEKSFLGQAQPTHVPMRGMVVGQHQLTITAEQVITASYEMMGMNGQVNTVPVGASYLAPEGGAALTASVNVGRISEGGAAVQSPNWARSLTLSMNNNLRGITAVGNVGSVEIGVGDVEITGTMETYFGSNAYYQKLLAGEVSNISTRVQTLNQIGQPARCLIWTLPRVTFTDGNPNAGGKNQDVTLALQFSTSLDPLTSCEIQMDRFDYFEV